VHWAAEPWNGNPGDRSFNNRKSRKTSSIFPGFLRHKSPYQLCKNQKVVRKTREIHRVTGDFPCTGRLGGGTATPDIVPSVTKSEGRQARFLPVFFDIRAHITCSRTEKSRSKDEGNPPGDGRLPVHWASVRWNDIHGDRAFNDRKSMKTSSFSPGLFPHRSPYHLCKNGKKSFERRGKSTGRRATFVHWAAVRWNDIHGDRAFNNRKSMKTSSFSPGFFRHRSPYNLCNNGKKSLERREKSNG
jgi:hypothetical protein